MKKIFISLLIVTMFLLPLKINAGMNSNTFTFIKTDEEGNFINDAEFKIHSLDGSIEYEVWKTVFTGSAENPVNLVKTPSPMSIKNMLAEHEVLNDGQYQFFSFGEEDYNKLLNILGTEERKIVENLKDLSKYNEYKELFDQSYSSEYARVQVTRGIGASKSDECAFTTPTPQSNIKNYSIKFMNEDDEEFPETQICTKLYVDVPVILILEETKAPTGLKKEKAIITTNYTITYNFNKNGNYLGVEKVNYNHRNILYKYDSSLDYSNILDFVRKRLLLTNDEEMFFKNDCGEYAIPRLDLADTNSSVFSTKNYHASKMTKLDCNHYPIIIDHKNGAVLTISSYVNNGGSTKAVKGSQVKYKVVVKNEGTEDSTNNVITSKIPEGFEYVEGSASDNGVYLESAKAVRWNIDTIGVESTKELTYKVNVTEDVDLDKTYTSTATIMNDSSDEIVSNETVVTLQGEIVNPKTGDARNIVVLFVLCVFGLILYYVFDHKSLIKL